MNERKEKLRKNFSIQIIEEVFEEQGRCCAKCGRSLLDGYEAHHKDGDSSNNDKENCELLCGMCHDAELWNTLKKQKEAIVGELSELIRKAIDGQIAGALMDKALDAIKLKLSLQKQIADIQLLEAPAISRIEYSEAIAEYNLKEYIRGVKDGIMKALELSQTLSKGELEKVSIIKKKVK
jgi:hypothetical protein